MARLTDGNKTLEIVMRTWNGDQYTPDWSDEFFNVSDLEYDDDKDAYKVEDVNYCADQAKDWQYMNGDYIEDNDVVKYEQLNEIERVVEIEEV